METNRYAAWIDWPRPDLGQLVEVEAEIPRLRAAQMAQLEHLSWLREPGRALWRDRTGVLRRARFTLETHFETEKGLHDIGSSRKAETLESGVGESGEADKQ